MTPQATETVPIQKTVRVPLPVEKAFRLFTAEVGSWWPVVTHSIGGEGVEAVFDGREGGRLYERAADGSEHDWGEVVAWDPPRAFTLDWRVGPESAGTQ